MNYWLQSQSLSLKLFVSFNNFKGGVPMWNQQLSLFRKKRRFINQRETNLSLKVIIKVKKNINMEKLNKFRFSLDSLLNMQELVKLKGGGQPVGGCCFCFHEGTNMGAVSSTSAWDCVFACDYIWPYDPLNGNYSEWHCQGRQVHYSFSKRIIIIKLSNINESVLGIRN